MPRTSGKRALKKHSTNRNGAVSGACKASDPHWANSFCLEDPDSPSPLPVLGPDYWDELNRLASLISVEDALQLEAALSRQKEEQKQLMRRNVFKTK